MDRHEIRGTNHFRSRRNSRMEVTGMLRRLAYGCKLLLLRELGKKKRLKTSTLLAEKVLFSKIREKKK